MLDIAPVDIIKANFDATVWEDGSITMGCVFRNEAGHILLAIGFECIYESVEEAEMKAAWETIRLMKERFAGNKL